MEFEQDQAPLVSVLRAAYLARANGEIHIGGDQQKTLFVKGGEVFVDRDLAEAPRLRELLAHVPPGSRPATVQSLRQLVEKIAKDLARSPPVDRRLAEMTTGGQELVGPLPTVVLLLELAVQGQSEAQLIELLGGAGTRFLSQADTPAVDQLPGLDDSSKMVLAAIEQPARVSELMRGAGSRRLKALHGLTKLWSVGLAQVIDPLPDESDRPSEKILSVFADRIADSLAAKPLEFSVAEHRRKIADLLAHHGEMNFYELLDVRSKATDREIFAAFNELARVVHPDHTSALGLAGKGEAIRFLFERVTEAYLTLADPHRRSSYNSLEGVQLGVAVDRNQRQKEKQEMARRSYRRASICLAEMDYSQAVDLLKEATRLDPQPDYFARLAQAQAKNPKWRHHALRAYEQVLELRPGDSGAMAAYGSVLEDMERFDEARQAYRDALAHMPDNVEAQRGLNRLR